MIKMSISHGLITGKLDGEPANQDEFKNLEEAIELWNNNIPYMYRDIEVFKKQLDSLKVTNNCLIKSRLKLNVKPWLASDNLFNNEVKFYEEKRKDVIEKLMRYIETKVPVSRDLVESRMAAGDFRPMIALLTLNGYIELEDKEQEDSYKDLVNRYFESIRNHYRDAFGLFQTLL